MPFPIPPAALAALLQSMPPEMLNRMGTGAAAVPGAPQIAETDDRRDRIKGAMMEAKAGFDAGLAATPVTGAQPPMSAPPPAPQPGAVEGAMTGGPFPQRIAPEAARLPGGDAAFPMSRGFRGGFPRFGTGPY